MSVVMFKNGAWSAGGCWCDVVQLHLSAWKIEVEWWPDQGN